MKIISKIDIGPYIKAGDIVDAAVSPDEALAMGFDKENCSWTWIGSHFEILKEEKEETRKGALTISDLVGPNVKELSIIFK